MFACLFYVYTCNILEIPSCIFKTTVNYYDSSQSQLKWYLLCHCLASILLDTLKEKKDLKNNFSYNRHHSSLALLQHLLVTVVKVCMKNVVLNELQLPSPCLSVYWKACTSRNVSSTDLPTGRSFMVICLRMPLSSMMKRPLRENKT